MKSRVIVSELAAREFAAHLSFSANVSRQAARETKQRIVEAIESLCEMPGRFPFFQEEYIPKNKYHKMFVQDRYLVLYQIRDNTVYVDDILDCRQDYGWLLK